MDALDSRIRELVAYARERDGEDRSNLFRNLVDLFLTGKAPQIDPTRGQLLDVLQALIPHVEAEGRRIACDLVANMSSPPMDLVLRLAQDRASIASSLLTRVLFDDDDLIELIEKTGREHHQLIASREDLSANIWIALARAAPSAPPFDHQSTLALWSDDLGITQTHSSTDRPVSKEKAPSGDQKDKSTAQPVSEQKSATVTALRPDQGQSASIRILRTDKDLIASRAHSNNQPQPETSDTSAEKKHISAAAQEKQPTALEAATHTSAVQNDDPLPMAQEEVSLTQKQAQDPGPGGWSWISDRDGFVTSVSPKGAHLLGSSFSSIGSSMLDLLGLNTKLGHPVARAFQRRSAIHDAPIFLPTLEDKNQHWTLEATPYFSACGGIFEGYEGVLTPVVPASDEDNKLQSDADSTALFLDDMVAQPAANLRILPSSFTDQASVFQTGTSNAAAVMADGLELTQTVDALKPTQQTLEEIATDVSAPVEATTDEPTMTDTDNTSTGPASTNTEPTISSNPLSDAAASVVKDVLAEALAPLNSKSTAEPKKAPETSLKAEALTSTDTSAHVAATLDLLEEALKRLTEAGKTSGDPQVRLQGEIASACVRSLKEQLP